MFSSEAPAKSTSRPGAGIIGRISSFVVGAGVTALGTQIYIYNEIQFGNNLILEKQKEIEQRLEKLEK